MWLPRSLPMCVALGLFACTSEEVHHAKLVLSESTYQIKIQTADMKTREQLSYQALGGFACADQQNADEPLHKPSLMFLRGYGKKDGGNVALRASLVVDTVRLDGFPRCRGIEIYKFCTDGEHECRPLKRDRVCFDLEEVPVSKLELLDYTKLDDRFVSYIKDGLRGHMVTEDAPDYTVMYRLVGTTETCAELDQKKSLEFDATKLLGCAYSCPLVPASARGDIVLDIDAITPGLLCESTVRACASELFSPAGTDDETTIEP